MNEPIIQANQNLVFNGDFSQATTGWKKGGVSVGVTEVWYENETLRLLEISHESWVSQEIEIPKTPGSHAQYRLSFLWETIHTESGWLYIFKGAQVLHEIELKPGSGRNVEQDRARLAAGQPLDFLPSEGKQTLDALFEAGDKIRIQIKSPKNRPNDEYSKVRITRINLELLLDPLQLQTVRLDGEILAPGSTLYLCLGATASFTHQLMFSPEPDNAWQGTEASLRVADNPQEAIIVTPGKDVDQSLTLPWSLDCPLLGDEDRYSFTLNLLNRYTAEPCTLAVSLGHHRLVFRDTREAAYYPVLGQSVRLGVQVASYYTGQTLDGHTVSWSVEGQGVKSAAVTDEQGWVWFDYLPNVVGDVVVEASVESPYYADARVTEQFEIRVLATDPWLDLLAVVEGKETAWDATGYPNRGSSHAVQVRLPDDSPLRGTEFSLNWSGDSHGQLGVDVFPELGTPVLVEAQDTEWTLTSEDRLDGRFELSLVCSKLLLPSPKKPMSLARNLVKVGDMRPANKFPIVDESESVLLRVQVVHVTVSCDGDPVSNALVDWKTPEGDVIATVTGNGGWASLLYTPKKPGPLEVMATIKAHSEASEFLQPFEVIAIATSPWKSEVKILLDGTEVERNTLGVLCRRGQTHTLRVEPVSRSPWINQKISLHWRGSAPDIGLVPSDLETPKPLAAQGVEWTLVSRLDTSVSSLFDLELRLEGVEVVRELSGRLVSADLAEEVSLMLDQIRAGLDEQMLYPCLGARHRFNVLPNALSPLAGLQASLAWSGTSAEELGATVQPALETAQSLSDGGALWTLDFSASEQPGHFALTLALPQLKFVATAKAMALAHNKVRIGATRESAVDPIVGQEPAWMWVQVYSHFTGNPVGQVPVKWWGGLEGSTEPTDNEGWSRFAFAAKTDGEHSVIALAESFFDGYEDSRSIEVQALQSDPWDDLMVSFDDLPPQRWSERTYFPRRGASHSFNVSVAEGSPLLDHELTLGMTGTGPAPLAIGFNPPALGIPNLFSSAGYRYFFTAGNLRNGSFALCFSSARLASLSPANAMSLGEGLQVVKIAERQRVNQTLLWGAEVSEQITVVSTVSGKPMSGLTVTWRSPDLGVMTSITNFYGVAKIRFVPSTPGAFELTASVGDALNSDSVSLPFYLNEPRKINALVSDDPPGYPGQEMTARVLVVSANTAEPLANVEVMWEYDNRSLAPTLTDADGKATVRFTLGASGEALLWASVKGGVTGWDAKSLSLTILEANHAAVESVVASVNPVPVNTFVTMTAQIVDRESRQPMSNRSILVSTNGKPFIEASTDRNGQYVHYWRAMDISDVVSLAVKVENSDGSSDSGAVHVTVVN